MLIGEEEWGALIPWVRRHAMLAVDCETSGLRPHHGDHIAGISLGDRESGFYVPFGHGEGFNHPQDRLRELLAALDEVPRLIGFNFGFDLHFLRKAGLRRRQLGSVEEVQVASHLYNENDHNRYLGLGSAGLKELADKYLGPGSSKDEADLQRLVADRFGKAKARTKAWKGLMWNLPASDVDEYASADALLTMKLRDAFIPYLRKHRLLDLYQDICDHAVVLQDMEYRGVAIDRDLLNALEVQSFTDMERYTALFKTQATDRIREYNENPPLVPVKVKTPKPKKSKKKLSDIPDLVALQENEEIFDPYGYSRFDDRPAKGGEPEPVAIPIPTYEWKPAKLLDIENLNMNSSIQMQRIFDAPSVNADALKTWVSVEDEARSEIAATLLAYRAAAKMHGSYFVKYQKLIDQDNVIHPSFNIVGTETGRLSCREPNLQAIPRDVENHKVKLLFVPRCQGGRLVEMDLSQAEIRLASFYGREWQMAEYLREGRDIHSATAALIGCDRSTAKRINFSAIYGIGAVSYSRKYGMPEEEARMNLEAYHEAYPGFRRLYSEQQGFAAANNLLTLPNGRRRHYFLGKGKIGDPTKRRKISFANLLLGEEIRKASSNLVQGMVAAWVMKAMIRIAREIPEMPMLLTVHDSVLFEIPFDYDDQEAEEMISKAHAILENPAPNDPAFQLTGVIGHPDCPMKVDVKITKERWGVAKEWHPGKDQLLTDRAAD